MNLNFYCSKCGSYLDSPKYKNVDNNTIELTVSPCEKCLKNEYDQGEKAAYIKLDLNKKLNAAVTHDLMDDIGVTNYKKLVI